MLLKYMRKGYEMADSGIHKKGEVDFSQLMADLKDKLGPGVGAVGSFIGIVREEAKKGGKVEELQYEAAEEAEEELRKIAEDLEENTEGVSEVFIHHIIDDLEPGDEIVYVLVGGNHREEVFDALPEMMDRVKEEVRIWKKEITEEDEYWVHSLES